VKNTLMRNRCDSTSQQRDLQDGVCSTIKVLEVVRTRGMSGANMAMDVLYLGQEEN
jgi:hypothetical protein